MPHSPLQPNLLYTKLHPPPVREKGVVRPHLLNQLDAAENHRLTLICAPAGYGKTTLLSQWSHQRSGVVGWVSLDRSDNDLMQFLSYVVAALQQIDPSVGLLILEMLQPPRPLSSLHIWITLINDIAASEKSFILVLDDYQEVGDQSVHEAMDYLLEHIPDNLHLILSTRANPPIKIPQLRARGQLLELRAADLYFSSDDARVFLKDSMGLPLTEGEVDALVQKAEGWIAGLQIAAIVLRNQSELPQTVQSFTGSHRHILDYLAMEVVERLPEHLQNFLHQTAILEKLEASLCAAVTGRSDSQQILEQLDRENQFVIPLDNDRHWYRYHRLMVEALQRWTEQFDIVELAELNRRAGAWYEAQGMIEPAIDHTIMANDFEHAAELIENNAENTLKNSQIVTLLSWLARVPEELISNRPRLNLAYAWALLLKGGPIQAVQARLETVAATGMPVPAEEVVLRALIANLTGEARLGLSYSQRALDDLPAGSTFLRSIAADNLGIAHVLHGNTESAIRAFRESAALARDSGNVMFAVGSMSNLGGLYLVQGQLKLADSVYRQALELATTPLGRRLPVASRALMGVAEIAREWNNLDEAQSLLEEALELSHQYGSIGELIIYLSLARVLQSLGDEECALELVQKARDIAAQSTASIIDDRLADLVQARLWLEQGNMSDIEQWAARRGFEQAAPVDLLPGDNAVLLPYDLREAEWILYARLQLANDRTTGALDTLTVLLTEAERRDHRRRLNEILVLMAIAHEAAGAADLALDCLERSLKSAEPEGYIRVYLDEGLPVVKLLREVARRGVESQYSARLLRQFQQPKQTRPPATTGNQSVLIEPLSERELEILQLLAEGYANREIGDRLYISLSTVKGHISNIFGKLPAKNRTEAVARARQLGILPEN